ncbi:hypothetical protein CDL12_20688 [Handroanthus impetiginosus]|uniref:Uncharacterized protein n=1 Tax=Handroanthus impetiginosus TaxID=429701 RepID=A0A2G9GNF2_9LAMI|nr:hypothetical protein CDL12_20688 [Handroanthus impetiginosus]
MRPNSIACKEEARQIMIFPDSKLQTIELNNFRSRRKLVFFPPSTSSAVPSYFQHDSFNFHISPIPPIARNIQSCLFVIYHLNQISESRQTS